jgi:hypothetical protein
MTPFDSGTALADDCHRAPHRPHGTDAVHTGTPTLPPASLL